MAEHDINWPKKFVPSQVSFLTGKDNNFIGKKVYLPLYVIFYCPEKVNVHVFFKQKDKVCDSQVRICLSLLLLQNEDLAVFQPWECMCDRQDDHAVSDVFGWSILKSPFLARHCPLTSYYMYFEPWPWNACYHTWCWSRSLDLLKRSSLLTFIDNYITWAGEGDLSNHIQN